MDHYSKSAANCYSHTHAHPAKDIGSNTNCIHNTDGDSLAACSFAYRSGYVNFDGDAHESAHGSTSAYQHSATALTVIRE